MPLPVCLTWSASCPNSYPPSLCCGREGGRGVGASIPLNTTARVPHRDRPADVRMGTRPPFQGLSPLPTHATADDDKLPPPPPREQRPHQSKSTRCFRSVWSPSLAACTLRGRHRAPTGHSHNSFGAMFLGTPTIALKAHLLRNPRTLNRTHNSVWGVREGEVDFCTGCCSHGQLSTWVHFGGSTAAWPCPTAALTRVRTARRT